MSIDQFDEYVDMVARARDIWQGRVDVRLGLEADYFAGYEPWLEKQLGSSDFHYVLGSVHPQTAEFRQRYWSVDPVEVQRVYFRLLADAAETKAMAAPPIPKVTEKKGDSGAGEPTDTAAKKRVRKTKPKDATNG